MKLKYETQTHTGPQGQHPRFPQASRQQGDVSAKRYAARMDSIKARRFAKSFGCQVVRIQRIFLKKDRFGTPIYKFVKHAAA